METLFENAGRLAARAAELRFSVLGAVYLGPGNFMKLSALQYGLVMLGGFFWTVICAFAVWKVFKPRMRGAKGDSRAAGELLAAFCVFYVLTGLYVTFAYPPTTDEPHYLTLTESILGDGDIDVADEYAGRDYTAFYPAEEIDAHAVVASNGRMYSQHTAGLPVLLLPFYALAGRWGVSVLLSLLAASLMACIYLVCRSEGIEKESAAATAVLAGVTVPLFPASSLVFTEVPAALLASLSLLSIRSRWGPPVAGSLLPWLHPRYAVISAGLCLLNILRGGEKAKLAVSWLSCGLLSAAAFLTVYRGEALVSVLNVITERYPARIEDLSAGILAGSSLGNPFVGLLGKFFDEDFGVLPFSPWLLVLIAGPFAPGGGKARHLLFLGGAGAYLLVTSAFRNWGGSAFPGRTLIPLLPFAAPYAARGLRWARQSPWTRRALSVLAGYSIFVSLVFTACPVLRYTSGREWMAGGLGSLWSLMPFTWFPSFQASALRASIIGAGVAAAVVLGVAARRGRGA